MEMFGILFFAGIGLIGAPLFCVIIENVLARFRIISRIIQIPSIFVVAAFIAEILLVVSIGPTSIRAAIGPAYGITHLLLFVLVAPCLACAILLRKKPRVFAFGWVIVAPICWVVGVAAILFQYHVSEALYGINGTEGPFSFP